MAQQLQQQMEPKSNWRMFFWIFIIAIIIFYVVSYYSVNKSTVNITYTKFKDQVKQGNIENIMIKGQQIQGNFAEKYEVPVEGKEDTLTYQSFSTVKPNIEDQELLNILEQNNVEVRAEEEGNSWMRIFLITMLPWILIIGIFIYARRKMQGQMGGQMGNLFNVGKSKAKKYQKSPGGATYDDVAGLKNAKKDLKEIIEYLKEPDKFAALGANIPKGILLVGPPGTGKTLLARATAGEADCEFFSISGSEFIEMFVGVGASRVRNMFEDAKKSAPSIIFIDEIDSVGRSRGTGLGGGHDEREQTLNQILAEMDGFAPNESVVVIAATNRPDVLDPALTRPGRFDRRVTLNLPQKEAREKILEIHVKNVPLAEDVDLKNLAARTVGFSGADIKNLVNEAALLAGRKEKKEVHNEDFDEARDKVIMGSRREDMMNDDEKKVIAYHEAGHTLLARLLPGSDPVQKVTIIPRGRSLGATEQIPEEDRHNISKSYLLNRITIMLGGRAAEKLMFDEMTTGAGDDLKRVTKIARRMITQWGMSEKLGPVTFNIGEDHVFLGREMTQQKDFSEQTAREIDEEIQNIVHSMEDKAVTTLQENKKKLEKLAQSLIENETLEKEDIDNLLNN